LDRRVSHEEEKEKRSAKVDRIVSEILFLKAAPDAPTIELECFPCNNVVVKEGRRGSRKRT
jgi:hypothetical protein